MPDAIAVTHTHFGSPTALDHLSFTVAPGEHSACWGTTARAKPRSCASSTAFFLPRPQRAGAS